MARCSMPYLFHPCALGIWLPAYGRNDQGSTVPTMENGLSFRTASSTPPLISAWVSQREPPSSMRSEERRVGKEWVVEQEEVLKHVRTSRRKCDSERD